MNSVPCCWVTFNVQTGYTSHLIDWAELGPLQVTWGYINPDDMGLDDQDDMGLHEPLRLQGPLLYNVADMIDSAFAEHSFGPCVAFVQELFRGFTAITHKEAVSSGLLSCHVMFCYVMFCCVMLCS